MEQITKSDLELFKKSLLSEIEKIFSDTKDGKDVEEKFGWLRSKSIRIRMNISPATLQNLRITGKIRFKKVLGSYYYNFDDIKKIFEDNNK